MAAKHGIESMVLVYLNKYRYANDIRSQRRFMEKALRQLQFFLNSPCCDDPEAVVEYSRLDNPLTIYIAAQLAVPTFDRRRWRKSLERAIRAIQKKLNDPCCCVDAVITSLPDTVSNSGGGETTNAIMCGVSAEVSSIGSPEDIGAALVEQLNIEAEGILTGVFTLGPDTEIIYTGCACEDAEIEIGGTSG
jgi:hypothetical protein